MIDLTLLDRARNHAIRFLESLDERPVHRHPTPEAMRDRLDRPLAQRGEDPASVIDALVEAVEPGLVATAGPRYFGFVIGGALPAALAADWLASAWDQNSGLYLGSPAGAACEEAVSSWLLDLLDLPRESSVGANYWFLNIRGPDWNPQLETYAIVVEGVAGVYEEIMRLEGASPWNGWRQ
jgi:hypothetical protein